MENDRIHNAPDSRTAECFANSWNNLPAGSVYTWEQFEEWLYPIQEKHVKNKHVMELGCGNGSLLLHLMRWQPRQADGIDLGESVLSAKENLSKAGFSNFQITQNDLTTLTTTGADVVYCIGVLHHLKCPQKGFEAVVRNVKPGGRFHCWVYAKEGNLPIRMLVEPLRKIFSKLPWWFTKYFIALPLAVPFFI